MGGAEQVKELVTKAYAWAVQQALQASGEEESKQEMSEVSKKKLETKISKIVESLTERKKA